MVPATSAKKRSLMPSGKLRQSLRGHGHRLSAIVQIGKGGITPALVKQIDQTLADHELVKVKVATDSPSDRFAVAERLAEQPGVNIVQIVGGAILWTVITVVFFRWARRDQTEGWDALQWRDVDAEIRAEMGR